MPISTKVSRACSPTNRGPQPKSFLLRLTVAVAAVLMLLTPTACRQKGLVCPAGESHVVEVVFDWEAAPNADPEGMTVWFFPITAGGRIWRFDIAGRSGGRVELPSGRYGMIAVNSDLRGATVADLTSYLDAKATARPAGSNPASAMSTGMLFGGKVADLTVDYGGDDGVSTVVCRPDSMAVIYTIDIRNVEGLERMRSASARLGGMARSVTLATGATSSDTCYTVSPLANPTASALSATTSGFGTPASGCNFNLTVEATLTDGKRYARQFDVSDQVRNIRYPRNVYIYIDSITLPATGTPGGGDDDVGLDVGVDGWQQIEIDITTGI